MPLVDRDPRLRERGADPGRVRRARDERDQIVPGPERGCLQREPLDHARPGATRGQAQEATGGGRVGAQEAGQRRVRLFATPATSSSSRRSRLSVWLRSRGRGSVAGSDRDQVVIEGDRRPVRSRLRLARTRAASSLTGSVAPTRSASTTCAEQFRWHVHRRPRRRGRAGARCACRCRCSPRPPRPGPGAGDRRRAARRSRPCRCRTCRPRPVARWGRSPRSMAERLCGSIAELHHVHAVLHR